MKWHICAFTHPTMNATAAIAAERSLKKNSIQDGIVNTTMTMSTVNVSKEKKGDIKDG